MATPLLPKGHVFQESDSNTCGPSCLTMVYAKKGINISVGDILKDFNQTGKGDATYVAQLAKHLLQNGIKTKIVISTSQLLSPAWKNSSRDEVIENLKKWLPLHEKQKVYKDVVYLLSYLEAGGIVEQESYTTQTIKDMLDRGSLVILAIDEDWVWGHRFKLEGNKRVVDDIAGSVEGHFVLVTGYKDNKFDVLDPFPTNLENRHGQYEIDMNQLLNASLTFDAEIIEILS